MKHTDLTFFTNEPERNLYERFNKILNSNTQFFDILVGYFRTSGFFRIYEAMDKVEKIRILVGLNVDYKTIEILNKAEEENSLEILSSKQSKDIFEKKVINEFENSDDSYDTEIGTRTFIDWLKNSKIEMRIHIQSPIHAKVYIMRKNMELTPDTYGSVITGSSNFSEAGLKNNLEFNVELKDSRDVKFALEKFEELWSNSIDLKDTYVETINNKTWINDKISPYELYLKTIYEFFKEEINEDKDASVYEMLPEGYMRLQYQIDAVTQAKKKLEAYGGVFIADVVGLGKTYICAMLAQNLKKGKKLIICPPVLVDYWQRVLLEFDVSAKVESLGKLDKIINNGIDDYKYVFIDEAHRFRNADTESFKLLHQICFNKKVVLISATPINNYSSDIENQLYLFQSRYSSTITGIKNLEGFFGKLNGALKKKIKGSPEYYEQLRRNSEEIRDKILRDVMIRRTRKDVMEFYEEDLKKQGLKFPDLGTPEKIVYTFDEKTDKVFIETINVIKKLDYARYAPLLYLKDYSEFSTMIVSQHNMSGFMKSILVKRLESSFFAFKMTLSRFIKSYEKFIDMCMQGHVYISKKVNVYDLLDNGDDDKLLNYVEQETIQYFKIEEFNDLFMPALKRDLALLNELKSHWDKITNDPKIEQFLYELKNNNILHGNKKIIFTESTETANYVGKILKENFEEKIAIFSGESSNYLKTEIENSFNPKYKDKEDKYDILITTDILAEGINLHRANVLINYDLPWNPAKIMQRIGRINRVGTEFEKIYVFNFFPTSQTSVQLPLKDRIMEKLQIFHDTLGEDFKYLSEDETVSSHKLYDELNKDFGEEEDGTNPELAYLKEIRKIRDDDTDLFEKIKKLPKKAKSGKYNAEINKDSTITFIRKGYLKMFFKTNDTDTEQISFMDAIKYIKSDKEEKQIIIGSKYFEHLDKNKQAFDEKLNEDEDIIIEKAAIKGNDAKMIKILKALSKCKKFTDVQDDLIQKMIILWTNGVISSSITKEILKDINGIDDELQTYSEIYDRIPDQYFKDKMNKQRTEYEKKEVILSCFLRKEQ